MTLMTQRPVPAGDKTIGQISRVFVGVDDSQAGLAAITTATELARSYGAQLVAVRTWALGLPRHGGRRMRHLQHPHVVLSFSGAEQRSAATVLISRAFKAAIGRMPPDVTVMFRTPDSDPAVALVSMANGPGDLIVVGTDGVRVARHLVHGSVSKYCTTHARCPVVVVPAAA